jgi:hypothetical protein
VFDRFSSAPVLEEIQEFPIGVFQLISLMQRHDFPVETFVQRMDRFFTRFFTEIEPAAQRTARTGGTGPSLKVGAYSVLDDALRMARGFQKIGELQWCEKEVESGGSETAACAILATGGSLYLHGPIGPTVEPLQGPKCRFRHCVRPPPHGLNFLWLFHRSLVAGQAARFVFFTIIV